ncbi:hypothetical protein [Streptomyces chattanoogensis]|uniref:hypothetical protein n=1 Tax=Streptomyces chattanoogensis TaxID=66876 RepID=UPI000B155BEA|nr:hypothetical protein [Streptomyces chattanoogensis]
MTAETVVGGARLLLVSVSTTDASTATRVRVWRKLRSLGALYLQQPVLPAAGSRTGTAPGGTAARLGTGAAQAGDRPTGRPRTRHRHRRGCAPSSESEHPMRWDVLIAIGAGLLAAWLAC